jgi:hypothetical protein
MTLHGLFRGKVNKRKPDATRIEKYRDGELISGFNPDFQP